MPEKPSNKKALKAVRKLISKEKEKHSGDYKHKDRLKYLHEACYYISLAGLLDRRHPTE